MTTTANQSTPSPAASAIQPTRAIGQGIVVTPGFITLSDGSVLEIATNIPNAAASRRQAVAGATLYCPTGRLRSIPYLSAYVGLSSALYGRASDSYSHWVLAQRKIVDLTGMALLRRVEPYGRDQLAYIEAQVQRLLSSDFGMISLTNTHTSAQLAAARLSRAEVTEGQTVAYEVAGHIWDRLFNQRTNPWYAPAANAREQAVRIVHRAAQLRGRAVDVFEIVAALEAIGFPSNARRPDFSTRRDLEQREPMPGYPRILSVWHPRRRRRLFYAPTLSRHEAIAGYDAAKARR